MRFFVVRRLATVLVAVALLLSMTGPAHASERVNTLVTAACVEAPCWDRTETWEGLILGPALYGGTFRFTETVNIFGGPDGGWDGDYTGTWSLTKGADSTSGTFTSKTWRETGGNYNRYFYLQATAGTGRFANTLGSGFASLEIVDPLYELALFVPEVPQWKGRVDLQY